MNKTTTTLDIMDLGTIMMKQGTTVTPHIIRVMSVLRLKCTSHIICQMKINEDGIQGEEVLEDVRMCLEVEDRMEGVDNG